jgi:thioredoxin 1
MQVSDASFEQDVLQSETPVLVDYWAPWCGPCKAVSPIVESAAEARASQLKVAQVNVDDNQEAAMRYGIRSIPTLMLFKGGESVATQVGAVSQTQLDEFLSDNLD